MLVVIPPFSWLQAEDTAGWFVNTGFSGWLYPFISHEGSREADEQAPSSKPAETEALVLGVVFSETPLQRLNHILYLFETILVN